jgi:hypothetical protein
MEVILSAFDNGLSVGEIVLNKSITIDASMLPSGIAIRAFDPSSSSGDGTRVFNIEGGNVTLKNLTLTGGDVLGSHGGAIRAVGDVRLTLDGVRVVGNSAGDYRSGGGLFFETS